ncbi:hypothetical protein JQC91_09635 [Jannaschia sp. Os4]|uniref:hypothetical protein n=1 Tax=Jannaschia sp. Os4 TaxID=2807617 RepID=UPI001939A391|nr:hypothetical protein [Jannaschia sp. Os4]MBM2576566.1 hypothetical protein [Jannaschia sp. Os4]
MRALSDPVVPRRIIAALILCYGAGAGWVMVDQVVNGVPRPPLSMVLLAAAFGLSKIAIGGALWTGRIAAWPVALVLAGLLVLQVNAPADASLAIDALSLAVATGLAIALLRHNRRNPEPA